MAHGERHLQILIGVQAVGIFKMSLAQAAGLPQQFHDLGLRGNQMHVSALPCRSVPAEWSAA